MSGVTKPDVAAEVRAALARQRRTQRWLSRQTGIGVNTLSRRCSGRTPFTVDELRKIALALDVPAAALLGEDAA